MMNDFETWWLINKYKLMEDENVGLREIARAAWDASRESAQPVNAPDGEYELVEDNDEMYGTGPHRLQRSRRRR